MKQSSTGTSSANEFHRPRVLHFEKSCPRSTVQGFGFSLGEENLNENLIENFDEEKLERRIRKKLEFHEKSTPYPPRSRFDEKSKPCIEKFVPFTKNPVCVYIIFIYANRKAHFSYGSLT